MVNTTENNLPDRLEFPVLFKISAEKYIKDIQSGKLYMNNLKYFVDLEKKSGKKGIGDIREASLLNIRNHELFIQINGGERQKVEIGPPPGIIYDEEALYHPVFCMVGKCFYLDKTGDREYFGRISLSEETLSDFSCDKDTKVLIVFNVIDFLQNL